MKNKEIEMVGMEGIKVFEYETLGDDKTPYLAAKVSVGQYGRIDTTDEVLIDFTKRLLRNKHKTPFEHCVLSFNLRAPIFVFRQLFRYRTASISEQSLRYTEAEPLFYSPDPKKEDGNIYYWSCKKSWYYYKDLVCQGAKKQDARQVLPVSIFSRALFTINLRNLFHIFDERLATGAQPETRHLVQRMKIAAEGSFPLIIKCYDETREE